MSEIKIVSTDRREQVANLTEEYDQWVDSMWFSHPHADKEMRELGERDLAIMGLGLGGEMGEVLEKCAIAVAKVQEFIKKDIRDHTIDHEGILKELGDVKFYAQRIAKYYGYTSADVIKASYDKLQGRRERGTERGSGDER